MTGARWRRAALAGAVLAAIAAPAWPAVAGRAAAGEDAVPARDGGAASAPHRTTTLQQIVVTASATGIRRLDAGYNIEVANRVEIRRLDPVNVGDLLQMVSPGTWSEPTGGKSAGATEVSGFPSTSGAPFSTVMVNGVPLYGAAQLSYMDTSTLLRLDDTIQRVEAVQGGTGTIFGPGQIGSTANFILRTGGPTPSGNVALTYGSEGRERLDAFYGFPIRDGWYGSIGGFYRVSDGVRDPQYKADRGGQLTATLKHVTDHGRLEFWGRVLNDRNLFLKQVPLVQTAGGGLHAYPGFDPLTGIYNSRAIQRLAVPSPLGGLDNADLADGRGALVRFVGGSYDGRFGAWGLSDHAAVTDGRLPTVALFPGSNPRPLSAYLYGCNISQPAGFCTADGRPVDTHTLDYPAGREVTATLPDGAAVPLGQSVIQQGLTFDDKQIKSFINDLRLSRELFSGNTLTAGAYAARYTEHDRNSSGNAMLLLNRVHTLPVAVRYVEGGATFIQSNAQGFVSFNGARVFLDAGAATNLALYLSDRWVLGGWTLVAGARIENEDARERTCNTRRIDQDGDPLTLYDNAVPACDGTWDFEHYDRTHPAFAASANYQFNDHTSTYVNGSVGGHFDDFANGLQDAHGDYPPMLRAQDLEAGLRYHAHAWLLDLNVYRRLFRGIQYQETDGNGIRIPGAISVYGADSRGVNAIAAWTPIRRLRLSLVGSYLDGRYAHDDACVPGFDVNGVAECLGFDGHPIARQPGIHYMFTPSYRLPATFGSVLAWVTWTHVGQRYEDQTGLQPLGAYDTLAAGVVAAVGNHWQVRVQGSNLTNELGITEGNTAVLGKSAGVDGVIMARPLFGREVFVQVEYRL